MEAAMSALAIQSFWHWFRDREHDLFYLERDRERVFADLSAALRPIHPDLVFEFSMEHNGQREFVISAGGLKAAFPAVMALAAAAPTLPRWKVVAFRQSRGLGAVQFGGTVIRGEDLRVLADPAVGKVDVDLLIPNYRPTPQSVYEQIGFLLMDQALGEYIVATCIGGVGFASLPSVVPDRAITLTELAELAHRVAAT
jgi:hypothetical protein